MIAVVSARRRIHVGAAIFYAFFLYVFSPMNLLVIGWFADFEDAASHRVHEVSIGALFTLGFIGVLTHLRRANRTAGAIQAVITLTVAAGVITISTGFEPLSLAYLLPPIALIALDPEWRRIVTPTLDRSARLLIFAAFLLVILGPDVAANFEKATLLVFGHESHWGAMAAFTVAVTLLAFIAGMRPPGWRLAAWSSIGVVTVLAVVSMAFRYDASALGVSHAIAALLWAGGYATTVLIVGANDPERFPVRRRGEGLVAGVASAVARRTGWSVGWVRVAFAVPLIGGAAYGVLWLALSVEGESAPRRSRLGLTVFLVFAGLVSVVTGSGGSGLLLTMALLVTMFGVGLRPLIGLLRRRVRFGIAAARVAATIGLSVALLTVTVLSLIGDDFGAPVVPHRIESEAFLYCASCHARPGALPGIPTPEPGTNRGAPVHEDIIEHSGGELCVSCHSHLPVSEASTSLASWWLPLMGGSP